MIILLSISLSAAVHFYQEKKKKRNIEHSQNVLFAPKWGRFRFIYFIAILDVLHGILLLILFYSAVKGVFNRKQ